MDAKKSLWNYTTVNYLPKDYYTFLYTNKLHFLFEDELLPYMTEKEKREHNASKKSNAVKEKLRFAEINHINRLLSKSGIIPIHFKGFVLSRQLFESENIREVGDLDMYVEDEYFHKAMELLLSDGFKLMPGNTGNETHHVALSKGVIYIELHRNIIKPEINIDTSFITDNTCQMIISGQKICTFDTTSTLLHLFYHAYSHMTELGITRRHVFTHKYIYMYPYTVRHMFDIALYIEKYKNIINWQSFCEDIEKQSLSIFFKELIMNFNLMFPEHISKKVYDRLINKEYLLMSQAVLLSDIFGLKNSEAEINPSCIFKKLFDRYWHGYCVYFDDNLCTTKVPVINSPFFYTNAEYSVCIEDEKVCVKVNLLKGPCFDSLKQNKMVLTIVNADGLYGFLELILDVNFEAKSIEVANGAVPIPVDSLLISANFIESNKNSEGPYIAINISRSVLGDIDNFPDVIFTDLHFNDDGSHNIHRTYDEYQYDPYSFTKMMIRK